MELERALGILLETTVNYHKYNIDNNNNNNLNIFMQDCCFSFKKKTAINAGPVKN